MADTQPKVAGILHILRKQDAPPALPSTQSGRLQIRVQVQGSPRVARVVLARNGLTQHVVQTDEAGNGTISGVVPGDYQATVQRTGKPADPTIAVTIDTRDSVLVIPAPSARRRRAL